jgi:hypothetical protein
MAKLSDAQAVQVWKALEAAKAKTDCPACGDQLKVNPNLFALQGGAASRAPGTAGPTGRALMCAALGCDRCGYVRLHSLVHLGLGEMV